MLPHILEPGRPSLASASSLDRHPETRQPVYVFVILAVALALRLAVVAITVSAHPAQWFYSQASELGLLAQSLVNGQGLSAPFSGSTGASAFLAPGYPALVAALFYLFGSYSMTAVVVLMVLQAIFATGTVAAILWLARRIFNDTTAKLAAIVWAVSPPLLFLPTIFWETSFSIFILTTLIAVTLFCASRPTTSSWIRLALCALAALVVNPSFATVVAGCFAWTLYQTRRTSHRSTPVAVILVFLTICSLWPIRNWRTMQSFIPLRSNMGYELWQGNRPGSDGFFSAALHPNTNAYEFERYKSLGEVGYMREKSSLAKNAILSDLPRFARLTGKRFVCFWSGMVKQSVWLMVAYTTTTALLGFCGAWLLWRRDRSIAILFLIPLVLLPLPYYLTHPDYRFRCVVDPLMAILAAHAVVTWTRSRKNAVPTVATG